MEDRCICCNEVIPEGMQVCNQCMAGVDYSSEKDVTGFYLSGEQAAVINNVLEERRRQDNKWGVQNHQLGLWTGILGEEYGELCEAINETVFDNGTDKGGYENIKKEAIQVAAVAVGFLECLERNKKHWF